MSGPDPPPEPQEPPPKGALVFSSDFESGNLGEVTVVKEGVYDMTIRPDTNNTRHRVWFYFGVQNHFKGQTAVFNITNFSKTKSLYRNGMTPVTASTSKSNWERLLPRNVFYYRSPRLNCYVLSFVHTFETEGDEHFFSYSYPYTYTQLQQLLHLMDSRKLPFYTRTELTRTLQHRRLDKLVITSPRPAPAGGKKKVVYLTARIHPGESPASFVMHGVLDFLTSSDPIAEMLRAHIEFNIVPMLNPDGVFLGNYRCSSLGHDLNRHWTDAAEWSSPELHAVKQDLARIAQQENKELNVFIDMHAHSTNMNAFCFANVTSTDPKQLDREVRFLRALDVTAKEFSLSSSRFCMDPTKAATGRRALQELLVESETLCYTLEVSFFAYHAFGAQPVPFTQDAYVELGRNTMRALMEFFKLPRISSREGVAILRRSKT